MFDNRLWERLAVFVSLVAVSGCSPNISNSTAQDSAPAVSQSAEVVSKESRRGNANSTLKQGDSIYQAPLPEISEFTWGDLRYFNLPLNNPPFVPPAKAQFMRGDDIVSRNSNVATWRTLPARSIFSFSVVICS